MKCTNKTHKRKYRYGRLGGVVVATLLMVLLLVSCVGKNQAGEGYLQEYAKEHYRQSSYQTALFASDLCVTDTDVELPGYSGKDALSAAGLFDLDDQKVLYSQSAFQKLYPASTTKIMTAYLAIKYGNPDDIVTVSNRALDLEPAASVCGLQPGDQITLRDLLSGLLLVSGNDAAVAVAEHISGSVEDFATLMNREAKALGATHTHFCNPHGLHEADHYTTAYDLYLIFNACLQQPLFREIISETSYVGTIQRNGTEVKSGEWTPTNYYSAGKVADPDGIHVIGGKTGTTDEAGCCVILYAESTDSQKPYIAIAMGAANKSILYSNMTELLQNGNTSP